MTIYTYLYNGLSLTCELERSVCLTEAKIIPKQDSFHYYLKQE